MYKLNIEATPGGLECVIKRRFFNKLWLVVYREKVPDKRTAKAIFKSFAY